MSESALRAMRQVKEINPDLITELDKAPKLNAIEADLVTCFMNLKRQATHERRPIYLSDIERAVPVYLPDDLREFVDDIFKIEKETCKKESSG